jgi:mRNA interferase MazF
MIDYKFGEVVLIAFPYTNGTGSKKRPALVLYDAGDPDVLVARKTSQPVQTKDDTVLNDWMEAGLLVSLTVQLHKVATLKKTLINRSLGTLSVSHRQEIINYLKLAAETSL